MNSSQENRWPSQWRSITWGVAVVGTLICAATAVGMPQDFFPAYLTGFLFWWGIAMGALALNLLHHLTGGGWGHASRRVIEAAQSTLPLLGLLFLPLAFGLPILYLWARPDEVAADPVLIKKVQYLNEQGWLIRAAVYFVLWSLLSLVLNRWTSRVGPEYARRPRHLTLLSGPGLLIWGLTLTFASVDWVMSLDPHWFSSTFGALFVGANAVSAISFIIVVLVLFQGQASWTRSLTIPRLHDLGNLLMASVLFWSYIAFTQFLIIWSGNLPEEVLWYIHRLRTGWKFLPLMLVVLHFAVPFLLLLSRNTKRTPRRLLPIAGGLLVMRYLDLNWLVMPTFSHEHLAVSWLNLVTPITIGAWWLLLFSNRLVARSTLPPWEPEEGRTAHSHDTEHVDERSSPAIS